jgi:hypothetical protein
MSKSNNTPAPATVNLAGKTAAEMRELITDKSVTAATVIAFLQGKEKLRAPSAALLAELTAAPAPAPVKAESKPVVKAESLAPAFDVSSVLARLAALEAVVSSLVEAVVKAEAPAPAPVKPVAAKPVVKPVAPVAAKPVAPVVAAKPEPVKVVAKPAAKRQEPVTQSPVPSEAEMRSALRGCATAQLREEAVASDIRGAETMNKGALIDALVALVLAEEEMIATPVTPAANAKGKGKPDLRVVRAEVEF